MAIGQNASTAGAPRLRVSRVLPAPKTRGHFDQMTFNQATRRSSAMAEHAVVFVLRYSTHPLGLQPLRRASTATCTGPLMGRLPTSMSRTRAAAFSGAPESRKARAKVASSQARLWRAALSWVPGVNIRSLLHGFRTAHGRGRCARRRTAPAAQAVDSRGVQAFPARRSLSVEVWPPCSWLSTLRFERGARTMSRSSERSPHAPGPPSSAPGARTPRASARRVCSISTTDAPRT